VKLEVVNPRPQSSKLVYGASSLGCLYEEISEEQSIACVAKALELGIRYFDTAPWYGAGLSETRLGKALHGRTDVSISTKCGRIIKPLKEITLDDKVEKGYAGSDGGQFFTDKFHMNRPCWDYTDNGTLESLRQSCERLGVDHIHSLRLHDAEDEERFAQATSPGGACDTMIRLKKEGKVKEISLGMNKHDYILRYLQKYPGEFDSVMLAGCFNLIDNDSYELLVECQKQGVSVTNVGVFASGLLWGGSHYKYDNAIPNVVKDKVAKWSALALKHNLSLPLVALNFAFLPKVVEMVAFGANRADQVDANLALLDKVVPVELWAEAKELGLIHESIPIPS